MFPNPSLLTRIVIGKTIGLLFGIVGFVALPLLDPQASTMMRWGILCWYPTLGALIGIYGLYDRHPVLNFPLPWWLRSSLIGLWMNLVAVLLAYPAFEASLARSVLADTVWASPFWWILEGVIVGLAIGFTATRLGGEGEGTLTDYRVEPD